MILQKTRLDQEGGFTPKREKSFSIDSAFTGHLMKVLIEMYSDPHKAVAREYIANAVDAHRQARRLNPGVELPRIEIVEPSRLSPTFSVRDYGLGMTEDETEKLLSSFGASGAEKRCSNDFVGGFGIGSKCAFTITDTYKYTVWQGGRKRIWICTVREDADKAIQLLSDIPSQEPTGVLVEVPIKLEDIPRVKSGVEYVLCALTEPVKLNGGDYAEFENRWSTLELGDGVRLLSGEASSFNLGLNSAVACGDFYYPVDRYDLFQRAKTPYDNILNQLTSLSGRLHNSFEIGEGKAPTIHALMNASVCLHFDAGLLQPTPNREAVKLESSFDALLNKVIAKLYERVLEEASQITESCETPLEVLRAIREFKKSSILSVVELRREWEGKEIKAEDLPFVDLTVDDKKAALLFPSVRRVRGVGWRVQISTQSDLASGFRPRTSDELLNELVDSGDHVYFAWAGKSKLLTSRKFSILEMEPMGRGQAEKALTTWWENTLVAMRAADPGMTIDDRTALDPRKSIVVKGTPDQRKVALAELEWLTDNVVAGVIPVPPSVIRMKRAPGQPKAERIIGNTMGWMSASDSAVWRQCKRPVSGSTVVYLIGRPDNEQALQWQGLRAVWDASVPGFKDTTIYALTQDAFYRAKGQHGYTMIPLRDQLVTWLTAWAKADESKQAYGMEVWLALGHTYSLDLPKTFKLGLTDKWDVGSFSDWIKVIDEHHLVKMADEDKKSGTFRDFVRLVSLRSGNDHPEFIGPAWCTPVLNIESILDGARAGTTVGKFRPSLGPQFELPKDALAALAKKIETLREAMEKIWKDNPSAAFVLGDNGYYPNAYGRWREKWSKAFYEQLRKI